MTAPLALAVSGLSKAYGARVALDGASFAVPSGSLTVLLGAAGAGKTTTLRLVAGLERPDAGAIRLGGRDAAGREPKDRDVAMIFDNLALYPNKTGFENIASPLRVARCGRAEIEARVAGVAETLRIGHVIGRLPRTMSGGERQRVALGRALVRRPSLFLLDEPLASLDAQLRVDLRAELRRLQRELGASFLFATPDYAEAMAIADTVVMLRGGRVAQVAGPQALYDAPVDRETARFVGAPEINLLPGTVESGDGGQLRFAGGSVPMPVRLRALLPAGRRAIEVGLRPEHLALAPPDVAPLRAAVADIEPLGLRSALTVHAASAEIRLTLDTATARGLVAGETVGLVPDAERLLAFDPENGLRLA